MSTMRQLTHLSCPPGLRYNPRSGLYEPDRVRHRFFANIIPAAGSSDAGHTSVLVRNIAALAGTILTDIDNEADLVAGGLTLITTLTGDTFDATLGADNAITTAYIAGLTAGSSPTNGWNNIVKAGLNYTHVTRNSPTQCTVLLPAFGSYAIDATEILEQTIPASVLVTSSAALVCSPQIQIYPSPPVGDPGTAPVYDSGSHTSLFYDDFSSYSANTDLFDGSGDNTWGPGDRATNDPVREIRADVGGSVNCSGHTTPKRVDPFTSSAQEGPLFGGKYLRLDYLNTGGVSWSIRTIGAMSNQSLRQTMDWFAAEIHWRMVGSFYPSKAWQFYGAGSDERTLLHHHKAYGPAENGDSCWWNGFNSSAYPNTTPRRAWGPTLTLQGESHNSNMGGPLWLTNYELAGSAWGVSPGIAPHPCEHPANGYDAWPSSGQWWTTILKVTRASSGVAGDGRYEMWWKGTEINSYPALTGMVAYSWPRFTSPVKTMDYNGAAGNCEAGLVHTAASGAELARVLELGSTTSGNPWNNISPYDNGCYIDYDMIRVWTHQ